MPKLKEVVRSLIRKRNPVTLGDLARIAPVERDFGRLRGMTVDRFYIDKFLKESQKDIQGDAMEVADDLYMSKFGSDIKQRFILHVDSKHPKATHIADLSDEESILPSVADCFICTQTYMFIYDFHVAIRSSYKLLKPGGVLLATVAGISQISRSDEDQWGDFFRFMPRGAQRAFADVFGTDNVQVSVYGNALAANLLLQGVVIEDLPDPGVLDEQDPDYPVIIGVRAVKND